jgi:ABC-2 type transport system ATP-binding protein
LSEMTEYCTSIGILEKGELLASGRIEEIMQKLQPELRLRIETDSHLEQLKALLEGESLAGQVIANAHQIECLWKGGKDSLPALHRQIVTAEIPIISFAVEDNNLEDIYMKISGHHTS